MTPEVAKLRREIERTIATYVVTRQLAEAREVLLEMDNADAREVLLEMDKLVTSLRAELAETKQELAEA